jgi:hypothetical protein
LFVVVKETTEWQMQRGRDWKDRRMLGAMGREPQKLPRTLIGIVMR